MAGDSPSNRTLGYYEFGKWPTIVDPRTTQNPDPAVTLVHENAHRDLCNNTIYGCLVNRLWMLSGLPEAANRDPAVLVGSLVDRAWQCIEGSATALEYLAVKTNDRDAPNAFMAQLPDDYRKALQLFTPIVDKPLRELSPTAQILLKACLITAIAEAALDWTVFTNPPANTFWDLSALLLHAPAPDRVLPDLVHVALRLPKRRHGMIMQGAKTEPGGEQILTLQRNAIRAYKGALLEGAGITGAQQRMIHDAKRMEVVAAWGAELKAQFQSYSPQRLLDGVYGTEVNVDIREPQYLLSEEEIESHELVRRVQELAAAPGFEQFVFEFFLDNRTNSRILMAKPIHVIDNGLRLGEPYLICHDATESVAALEALPHRHLWLTRGLLVGNALEPYDREFICARRSPVFLELRPFNWCMARRLLEPHAGPVQGWSYSIKGYPQFEVAALSRGNATVFGITPPGFPPAQLFVPDAQSDQSELESNAQLSAAVLIVMHHSKEHAIIPE